MFIKKDNCESVSEVVERNVGVPIEEFLKEETFLEIHNLEKAANMIKDYISTNKTPHITIVGDYDSDGVNATAILYWALRGLKVNPVCRLPRRFSEGYGLNTKIIDEIPSGGLLITVDNGIAAYDAIKKAKDKGLIVIVTDHHLAPVDATGKTCFPPADIIVDPSAEPASEFHGYCGAAIAYRLAKLLLPTKKLRELEVLASIATVTDVMPLTRENRAIVKHGLEFINEGIVPPGLKALISMSHMGSPITADSYGYNLGPCFNASGRLYDDGAERVLSLMTEPKLGESSYRKAKAIIETNEMRKQTVKKSIRRAASLVNKNDRPVVIYDPSFEEGIIGIIAGKISEQFNCPAIVFTDSSKEGVLKGSGRSTPGLNLKSILDKVNADGFIVGYGGHAGAAGLSIKKSDIENFKASLTKHTTLLPEVEKNVEYDLVLTADNIGDALEDLNKFAPFGEGNPKPIFRFKYNATNGTAKTIGDGSHFMIKDDFITIMGFELTEKWEHSGKPMNLDMVGYLSESIWNNKTSLKFELIDFMPICD